MTGYFYSQFSLFTAVRKLLADDELVNAEPSFLEETKGEVTERPELKKFQSTPQYPTLFYVYFCIMKSLHSVTILNSQVVELLL